MTTWDCCLFLLPKIGHWIVGHCHWQIGHPFDPHFGNHHGDQFIILFSNTDEQWSFYEVKDSGSDAISEVFCGTCSCSTTDRRPSAVSAVFRLYFSRLSWGLEQPQYCTSSEAEAAARDLASLTWYWGASDCSLALLITHREILSFSKYPERCILKVVIGKW